MSRIFEQAVSLLILFFLLPWLLPSVRYFEIFLFVLWYIGRFALPPLLVVQLAMMVSGIRSEGFARLNSLQVISMTLLLLTVIRISACNR